MRSSACKYVLDKVSKFEKKYAKPIQKSCKREDDVDFLSFKDDNSSSEHTENITKVGKKHSASHSDRNQSIYPRKRLDGLNSLGDGTMDISRINSFQDTNKPNKKKRENVKQKTNDMENNEEYDKYECNSGNKILDIHFLSEDDSLLRRDIKRNNSFEDINESFAYELSKDLHKYAGDHLKDTFISLEKNIDSGEPGTPFRVDINEGGVKNGRLQVSLNLKLDKDPEEISDMSSKGIASLSSEKSNSSENIPVNVFTFEDLIGVEELKSISESKENDQVKTQISRTVSNSTRISVSIDDDIHFNSKSKENINEISTYSSAELEVNEIKISESSVEEDIEEVIDISDNENCNASSENIHSFSKKVVLSTESDTKMNKNTIMSENSQDDISKLEEFKSSYCSVKTISEFAGEDSRGDIYFEKNESDVINHNVDNNENEPIKFDPEEVCDMKNHSEQVLKLTLENHNRVRKKDFKHINYVKQNRTREKYLEHEWKVLNRKKNILQNELRNVSTQTEEFLAKTYDFEKKMKTIMKTSLNSVTDVDNFSLEINNLLSEQTSHSVSASDMKPIERGFHCALRQQIELTKHFVCAEYNMYAVCMAAIKEMSSSYRPATLHHSKKMKRSMSSKKTLR